MKIGDKKYETIELNQRVSNIEPALLTRFKWRAEREAKRLNNLESRTPFYRWVACDWLDGRWAVVAMQNQLRQVR